jgi:hypothetical protein
MTSSVFGGSAKTLLRSMFLPVTPEPQALRGKASKKERGGYSVPYQLVNKIKKN